MATAPTTEVGSRVPLGIVNRPDPATDRTTTETANPAIATEKRPAGISPASGTTKTGRGRRGAAAKADSGATRVRFFLLTKECIENGKIALADEVKSEDDALVASLVQGVPFVRIETWIASAQKHAGSMVIEKRSQ